MGQIKFGLGHMSKPTPAGLNRTVRVITVILGVFLGWMNTNDLIGEAAQHIINSIGGLVLGVINAVAPMFGIEISDTTEVAAKDVTSMETPKNTEP